MVWLALTLAILNGLVIGYYWLLPLLGSGRRSAAMPAVDPPVHRFALVVPAHNEEATIRGPLESHARLDYPAELFMVFVIADNCTDGTAKVARSAGAVCLVRQDAEHRGKGHALGWAFERILPLGFDASVVLDADCRIDPHALRVFDRELRRGARVLQARDAVSNPDASPISYAAAVGNVIENDLFYAPKSRLGLSVLLRGTGMVLHREILEQQPWLALSNTEDIEYSLSLIERGIATRFLPGVSVWSDFPENAEQLQVQRRRWASGSAGRVGVRSFRLIGQGLRRGEAGTIDAGWTLAVLSRPMVIVSVLLGLIAAGAGLWWGKEPLFLPVFLAACANALALVAYFGWGILRLGVTRRRMIMLLSAPWAVCQLVVATVLGSLGVDRSVWRQTPRAGPVKVSGLEEGVHQGKGESV